MPELVTIRKEDLGDNLIKEYVDLFSSYSFKNELYGRLSLHVLLGQALKNVHYRMGSREIDVRVHLLLIKPQGTGKGAGYGFIEKMARKVKLNFQSLTESTDAGLAGIVEYDANLKEKVVADGLLKTSDIIGMEEASVLFDFTSEFSKKNMIYMQITMNALADSSCMITKRIGGITIDFKPHASFVLMTYPPDKLVDKIVKTGFIDRLIPLFEDVSLVERLEVIKKMTENINISTTESYDKAFEDVVAKLNTVISKYQKANVCMLIPDNIHKLMLSVIDELTMKILDASPKAREKLEHFISRLYENLMKFAMHHAILDLRTSLDVSDVIYARLLYKPIWRNLIISIESLLIISPTERHRKHRIIQSSLTEYDLQVKLKKHCKLKVWVRRRTMVENLKEKWDNCSWETADNNLRLLEKIPKVEYGEFGKVASYEKDKFFERKYVSNIAYLRKIKDIK